MVQRMSRKIDSYECSVGSFVQIIYLLNTEISNEKQIKFLESSNSHYRGDWKPIIRICWISHKINQLDVQFFPILQQYMQYIFFIPILPPLHFFPQHLKKQERNFQFIQSTFWCCFGFKNICGPHIIEHIRGL